MNRMIVALIAMMMVWGYTAQSHAALFDRGSFTDSFGNQNHLIYDSDLNVTWYDYTNTYNTWQNQKDWATNKLAVNVNGNNISGWRLPTTVDGLSVYGYDGTTTAGYNITSSGMGHLYYAELGNNGGYDTSGKVPSSWGLKNTGPFHNLVASGYWSGTAYAADTANTGSAWYFYYSNGYQNENKQTAGYLALAVHDGDVAAPVPIPGTLGLLGSGLAGIFAWSRMFGRRRG